MLFLGKYVFRAFSLLFFHKTETKKFGTHYGGWQLPVNAVKNLQTLLSAGAGEDISFEVELVKQHPNVMIHIFDPTPLAKEHLESFFHANHVGKGSLINMGKKRHPRDAEGMRYALLSPEVISKVNFHPLGWSGVSKTMKFYIPNADGMVSLSTEIKSENYVECRCEPVSKLMKAQPQFNSKPVAIKMDIEGSEYAVIKDLSKHKLLPFLLMFEIHIFNLKNFFQILSSSFILLKNGYRCYYMEGDNYGFIKTEPKK